MADNEHVLGQTDIEALSSGRDFEALVRSPAWKLLLDWLEGRSDEALTEHKLSLSTDPIISHVLKMRWRERDDALNQLQKHVYRKIEVKRALVQGLIESGITPAQLDSALSAIPPTVVGAVPSLTIRQ